MFSTPVNLGHDFKKPFTLAPIPTRKQPPKLTMPELGKMKKLAWGWSGYQIGDVPEVVVLVEYGSLMLWEGENLHDINPLVRPDIDAALKNYDPSVDPYGRGGQESQTLGLDLKRWRAGRGWTAKKVAEELGIPVRTVQGIEQGRGFGFKKILRLALEALDARSN